VSTSRSREVSEVFATLSRSQAGLALDHRDLCFLVALHVHMEGLGLGSVPEETLRDVFERTWEHVEPDAVNPQKAATERIGRLRDQRLLTRFAASRYASESDYSMSSLAQAIVRFFYEDDRLTRESLDVLTATLVGELVNIRRALDEDSADRYPRTVTQPLRVSVGTLVEGITNRQRGLDREQEQLRDVVTEELSGPSEQVLDRCSALLEEMGSTLRELHGVLMSGCTRLNELVEEIAQRARALDEPEVMAAADDVADKLARVEGWGQSRLDTWTEYHEHIHRHLRMVVSLDPNRALSHALRELVRDGPEWHLRICQAERYAWLQEPARVSSRLRVARQERPEEGLEAVEAEPIEGRVERAVKAALARGPVSYLALARELLPETPQAQRFGLLGELARQLARHGIVDRPDRAWHELGGYEVKEWEVHAR